MQPSLLDHGLNPRHFVVAAILTLTAQSIPHNALALGQRASTQTQAEPDAQSGHDMASEPVAWSIRALETSPKQPEDSAARAPISARSETRAAEPAADGIVELAGFIGRPTPPSATGSTQMPSPPAPPTELSATPEPTANRTGSSTAPVSASTATPTPPSSEQRIMNVAYAAARTLTPDASRSRLIAINSSGQLLGVLVSGNIEHAFITTPRGDELIMLGAPGLNSPVGFNSSGRVVGTLKVNGADRAYVSGANGAEPLVDLESLPVVAAGSWSMLQPTRIEDNGQITGKGLVDGKERVFVLTQFKTPACTTPDSPTSSATLCDGRPVDSRTRK